MDELDLSPWVDALGNAIASATQAAAEPQPSASKDIAPAPASPPAPDEPSPAPAVDPLPARPGDTNPALIVPGPGSAVTRSGPAIPPQGMQPAPSPAASSPAPAPTGMAANPIAQQVMASAKAAGLPPAVVGAIVWQESRFNPGTRPIGKDGKPLSSATGLFQMLDSDRVQYGVPANAPVEEQIAAGIKKTQANWAAAKAALGRDPNAAELYVVHYQGVGAGPAILKANPNAGFRETLNEWGRANGKGNWGDVVFRANPWFEKDGLVSNADFIRWSGRKIAPKVAALGGDEAAGFLGENVNTTRTISYGELSPAVSPAGSYSAQTELQRMDAQVADRSVWEVTKAAFQTENLTARFLSAQHDAAYMPAFAPDPGYQMTEEEMNRRKQGLPEKYWPGLVGMSPAHSDWLERRAREDFKAETVLTEAGWTGVGASVLASVLDPGAIAAGELTAGLASMGSKAASLGRSGARALNAAGWGVGNVAAEAGLGALGVPRDVGDYALAAGLGASLGFAFGPLARNPATADLALEGAMVADMAARDLSRSGLMGSTALSSPGGSLSAATNLDALAPIAVASDWSRVSDTFVDRTALGGKFRVDIAGQLGSSPNPTTRLAASHLVTDAVGKVDGEGAVAVNPRAADQTKTAIVFRTNADLARTYEPAFDEWATAKGLSRWEGRFGVEARTEFGELVSSYMRTRIPDLRGGFPEPVRRVGDKLATLYGDLLLDNQNPLRHVNGAGRPMPGLESVERNPHYVPIVYDDGKIAAALERHGERAVTRLLSGSLRSGNPGMEEDIADRIAEGVLKNFRRRAAGLEHKMSRAMSGVDADFMRDFLADLGLPQADMERALGQLTKQDKSAPGFTKPRLGFDENFVLPDVSARGELGATDLRFSDLTVNDAIWLFSNYSNTAAGWVALGRMVIEDPTTGNRLVNGLRSEQEIEQFLHRLRGEGADRGIDPKRLQDDEDAMRFALDRILGQPNEASRTDAARWAGVIRNWNFARLMGNLGIAQLMEVGAVVSNAGIRAMMQHMPAVRRIVEDGATVLRNRLDRELEAVLGIGTDPLRGTMAMIHNEAVGAVDRVGGERLFDKAELRSRQAAHLVNVLSGGRDITAGMQKWTAKLMAQKFADMAEDAIGRSELGAAGAVDISRLSRSQLDRLRYLGLDDDMLGRVLTAIKANAEFADGAFFPGKLLQLNLDHWSDVEARSAFESALFRASRKIIQETDVGAMTRWSSSPIFQTIFQFRTFAITAWANQFLHNVAMKDFQSFVYASSTMLSAALVYAAQAHLQAQFESDPETFREKRLNPTALALASFQRAGWSSIIPMAVDTALFFTPYDPMFDFRTTAQPSNVITGNPTFGLFDDLRAAVNGATRPLIDDRQFSQQEARAITRIMALQNWMPLASLYSTMIADLPAYKPRREESWRILDRAGLTER